MRLGFSVAVHADPDIFLIDEILGVGDAAFQQRSFPRIKELQEEGKTIVFVSHAPAAIRAICRRVCLLDQGKLLFDGNVEEGLQRYERVMAGAPPEVRADARTAPSTGIAEAAADVGGEHRVNSEVRPTSSKK